MTLAHRIRIAAAALAAACLIPAAASAGTSAGSPRVFFSADVSPRISHPRVVFAFAPRVNYPRGWGYRFP